LFVRLNHVASFIVNAIYRASCNGVEIRIVQTPDRAYLAIRKPHSEPSYRELADGEVGQVLSDFEAIGEDPEKFAAFCRRVA
jgi:hypothetical protein